MWPFSRRRETGRPAASEPPLRRSVAPQPWRDVPALAPSVTPIPLTLAPQRFADDLASWQPPQPYLAPLGHTVSPQAPSGAVDGLTRTIGGPAADSGGPAMVLRQTHPPEPVVQRSFAHPVRPQLPAQPSQADPATDEVHTAPTLDDSIAPVWVPVPAPAPPPSAAPPSADPSSSVPDMPLRTVPATPATPPVSVNRFSAAASVDVPVLHLPATPAVAEPARAGSSEPGPPPPTDAPALEPETSAPLLDGQAGSEPAVAAPPPEVTGQAGVPVQRSPQTSDPAMPLATSPASPPSPQSPSPQAPVLGEQAPEPRKLGLGAPLHRRPDEPPAADAGTTAGDSPPPLPLQRRAEPSPPTPQGPAPQRPAPTLGLGPPLGSSAPREVTRPHPDAAPPDTKASAPSPPLPPLATPPAGVADAPPPSGGEMTVQPLPVDPVAAAPPASDATSPPATPPPDTPPPPEPGQEAHPEAAPLPDTAPDVTAPLLGATPPVSAEPTGSAPEPGVVVPDSTGSPTGPSLPLASGPSPRPADPVAGGHAVQRLGVNQPLPLTGGTVPTGLRHPIAPLLGSSALRSGGGPGGGAALPPVQRLAAASAPARPGPRGSAGSPQAPTAAPAPSGTTLLAPAPPPVRQSSAGLDGGLGSLTDAPLVRTLPVASGAAAALGSVALQRAMGAPTSDLDLSPLSVSTWRPGSAPTVPRPPREPMMGTNRGGLPAPAIPAPPGLPTSLGAPPSLPSLPSLPPPPGAPSIPAPPALPSSGVGPLATAGVPQEAPSGLAALSQGVGPLLLPQEAPSGLAALSQGVGPLLPEGVAGADGPNGVPSPQAGQAGGGEASVATEQEEPEAEPQGGGLGHPRTWDAETLDELSRRLYAGISRRIKQELRTDRERAGRLMDLRR